MPDRQRPEEPNAPPALTVIGRKEYVGFPAWDLHRIRAKIDTGAFSSALDVAGYEIIEGSLGPLLRLAVVLSRRRADRILSIEEPLVGRATVRGSTGCSEERPVIEPVVHIGTLTRRIRLTVNDRSKMRCRMLLGRQAIAGLFLVDPSAKYLLGGRKS